MYLTLKPRSGGQFTEERLQRFRNVVFIKDITHNKYYALVCNYTEMQIAQSSVCVETIENVHFNNMKDIMYVQRTGNLKKTNRQPIRFEVLDREQREGKRFTLCDFY